MTVRVEELSYNSTGSANLWPWKMIYCDTTAERDAIPAAVRVEGMRAFCVDTLAFSILNGSLAWVADSSPVASYASDMYLTGDLILPKTSGKGIKIEPAAPTFPWRDIIGKVVPKATGVGSPTRAAYIGGSVGQYAFVANDVYDCEFHIPHDYVPGTDIYIHVHWSHNGTTIIGNAVFDFFHTYAKGHNQGNFAAEKNLTITYATVDVTTTPRYRHRIDEVIMSGASATSTLMDRDDIEPDGLILLTIRLITLPTIGGGGNLFIHTTDIHYQSTSIGTKNKAPNFYA